jgi:hypothetical protein
MFWKGDEMAIENTLERLKKGEAGKEGPGK